MRDVALARIVNSPEWDALPPVKRQALGKLYKSYSPEKRAQLAERFSLPAGPHPEAQIAGFDMTSGGLTQTPYTQQQQVPGQIAKGTAEMALSTAVSGLPALATKAGPLLRTGLEMAANVGARKATQAVGLSEGNPLSLDWMDAVNAAVPAVLRGGEQVTRLLTKPGQRALQHADEANAALTTQYADDLQTFETKRQDWINRGRKQAALEDSQLAELTQARNTAIQQHKEARAKVYPTVEAAVGRPNVKAQYAEAKVAAEGLPPLDLTDFRETAKQAGIDLRLPGEGTQSRFMYVTDALKGFGGEEVSAPINRVTRTIQQLGRTIGRLQRTGGDELKTARELYASLHSTLQQAAEESPQIAQAVDAFLAAQAAQRKAWALDDYKALFGPGKGYSYTEGQVEMHADRMKTSFDQLVENDRFFAGSFTPDELGLLRDGLQKVPSTPIPKAPEPRTISKLGSNPPGNPPQVPETVEPVSPSINWQRAGIVHGAGWPAGLGLAGMTGMNPFHTATVVAPTATLASMAPELISKYMLAGPGGQKLLRQFMANKQVLSSTDITYLEAMGRAVGILP